MDKNNLQPESDSETARTSSGRHSLATSAADLHPHNPTIDERDDPIAHYSPPVLLPMQTCICGCGGDPCIPQRPYRRHKGDPLEGTRLGELITFQVHGQCGIPLSNALSWGYSGLSGRDDPMFVGSRASISIRVEWPGCPSWAQQMRTKDWRRSTSPITKAKLAMEVAKKVNRFLKDMNYAHRGSQASLVGVDIDHLALVALEHVALASWQPHFRLIK